MSKWNNFYAKAAWTSSGLIDFRLFWKYCIQSSDRGIKEEICYVMIHEFKNLIKQTTILSTD